MFHLVSLSLQISLADLPGPCLGLCVGVACFWLVLFLVGFFLPGKFDFNLMLIPVVDRPCLALVRQCREKNRLKGVLLPHPDNRSELHGSLPQFCFDMSVTTIPCMSAWVHAFVDFLNL